MSLEFRHIAHAYGDVAALKDIELTAPTGEITCLLGASGCGKSTLLGLAAGLLSVQRGSIYCSGEMLADENHSRPPEARPVGLMFQDGALFPHMTLARNVAFGLPRDQRSDADLWLSRVGLEGLGQRYPHQLSGGQQQRAALARAMAPQPPVLLMDEPFASVDIVLRRQLRRDCRKLLRSSETTTLLVTHDPDEALDIADNIAVMEKGRIVQFGTPAMLYDAPAAPSVGAIFGGAQKVTGWHSDHGGVECDFGVFEIDCVAGDVPDDDAFDLLIYADAVRLAEDPKGLLVRDCHLMGAASRVVLTNVMGGEISIESRVDIEPDQRYRLVPDVRSLRAFARR